MIGVFPFSLYFSLSIQSYTITINPPKFGIVTAIQVFVEIQLYTLILAEFVNLLIGNGYRSIITIVESCLQKILLTCQQIQRSRDKLFFRSYHVYMELESYTQVLTRLLTIANLAIVLLDYSEAGNLFPRDTVIDDMIMDFEKISRECFYGRTFGFQVMLLSFS